MRSLLLLVLVACSSTQNATDSGVPNDGAANDVATDAGDAATTSCDAFGHFGVPASTFALQPSNGGFYYDDIQKALPNVDWSTLDRLYLPAGTYKQLQIGNLPARDAQHPLVITNQGGQVVVGPSKGANYIWSMGGGSGWVLTGRYDPTSLTGDVNFPGHRCGAYANAKYGIVSDDDFDFTAPYLHMGLGVSEATDFEIEYVEVKRSGFAGIRLLNSRASNDPPHTMANARVHDVYVHDTGGEGFYFGWTGAPPSNLLPGLQIYNSRILRTGNEALQIQDLGDGSHVHHNVFASGGLHWLDNGLGRYQDNATQEQVRTGNIEIDHNVIMDGAGSFANSFYVPETGDGPFHVDWHDDFFGNSLSLGVYIGGAASAQSTVTFENCAFRGLVWGYDIIAKESGNVFGVDSAFTGSVTLKNNTWEGTRPFAPQSAVVTQTNNTNAPVPDIEFENAGWPLVAGHHLTAWAPNASVVTGSPAVTYHAGDVVTYGDAPDLYACKSDTTAGPPDQHPEAWTKLAAPVDDMRVKGATYAGYGIQ